MGREARFSVREEKGEYKWGRRRRERGRLWTAPRVGEGVRVWDRDTQGKEKDPEG